MATFPPSHQARVESSDGCVYQKKYFRISYDKWHLLSFFEDEKNAHLQMNLGKAVESGHIDMMRITDVQISDSPQFALTLMSAEMNYILVAEDQATMIRWALSINSLRPEQLSAVPSIAAQMIDDEHKKNENEKTWSQYEYTYQTKGFLGLNLKARAAYGQTVKGETVSWNVLPNPIGVAVGSFYIGDDGNPGCTELLGIIRVDDEIQNVNGIDVTMMNYSDALNVVKNTSFPKTLQFKRDNRGDRDMSRLRGWVMVYHTSLTKYSRRYVDIRWDSIYFRKPLSGALLGAKSYASISMDKIDSIKPIIDKTMPKNRQFIIRLYLISGEIMNFSDHNYDSPTSTSTSSCVAYIDICFSSLNEMNKWRSTFASPNIYNDRIPMKSREIVQSNKVNLTEYGTINCMLCILTNKYVMREFILYAGLLIWYKVGSGFPVVNKRRGIELYTCDANNIRSVRAVRAGVKGYSKYEYQLELTTSDQFVTIVFDNEVIMLNWLKSIKEHVEKNENKDLRKVYFSENTEIGSKLWINNISDNSDVENIKSTIFQGTKFGAQGLLFVNYYLVCY